jgi:tetratricopeptide (TPR) repeat protein
MGLLEWLKTRLSHSNTDHDFDASLLFLLKGAHSDLELKNFGDAQRRLLEVLEHRGQVKDQVLAVTVLNHLGATWWLQDKYREGIAFFTDYIARYPDDAEAYSQRATMLWYSGEAQKAVSDYSHALKSSPDDIFALSGRGQALVEINKYNEALNDLDLALRYLEQHPNLDSKWRKDSQAYIRNGRAAAFAGLGEFGRALKEFDISVSLCPHNAWAYFNRAHAYDVQGERVRAIADYRVALIEREPRLSRSKIERAETRLRDLLARKDNELL